MVGEDKQDIAIIDEDVPLVERGILLAKAQHLRATCGLTGALIEEG